MKFFLLKDARVLLCDETYLKILCILYETINDNIETLSYFHATFALSIYLLQ